MEIKDKELQRLDKAITATLDEIERRIPPTSYSRIENLLQGLMKLSYEVGERMLYARIDEPTRTRPEKKDKKALSDLQKAYFSPNLNKGQGNSSES